MEAVGKLNDDDADIFRHAKEDLTVIFGFEILLRPMGELHALNLRQRVDNKRDVRREFTLNILNFRIGVFDNVVKKTGCNRLRTALERG